MLTGMDNKNTTPFGTDRGALPIEGLRREFLEQLARGPVVVTAPTGTGKSTVVPRWCASLGRVLVIEPRRVACRSLAQRVAQLEGGTLGERVGYSVRDEHRAGPQTELLFATPGIVLRLMQHDKVRDFKTVIIDEFHERGLEVDLLLALLMHRHEGHLAVMSATLEAGRVARHLGGVSIEARARQHPIRHLYLPEDTLLPDSRGLLSRLLEALESARALSGDILVFLPGKAEITKAYQALTPHSSWKVLTLHGGLTLEEQSRAFEPGSRRKVILATNVAETSITLPGIGVVVDSGLVRQTRYHYGRGYLTLVPVASDSAEQRAGRAGRTGPGVCIRLWSKSARLEPLTLPEIYREDLSPLVLASAACRMDVGRLPFLDPPKPHALAAAKEELTLLRAIDEEGRITERGSLLFGQPLDAPLAGLLVEAEKRGCLEAAIDLVAVLAVGRPLFASASRPAESEDDLRLAGCDATAFIRAVRMGNPERHGLRDFTLQEARQVSKRLRRAWKLPPRSAPRAPVNLEKLARAALAADPRSAHVARHRKGKVAWANGGTEIELSRESAINVKKAEAVAVLGSQAVGLDLRKKRVFITCAMPLRIPWLLEAGFGRDRVASARLVKGKVVADIERVYARRVLGRWEEAPRGALAVRTIGTLFLEGRIFPESLSPCGDRLDSWALYRQLKTRGLLPGHLAGEPVEVPAGIEKGLEPWVLKRLEALGVESGGDLGLLSAGDLLPDELPREIGRWLDKEFPRTYSVGDAHYRVEYQLIKREVTLHKVKGKNGKPPPLSCLPAFAGFRILEKDRAVIRILRDGP